ncbi:hypothetical protein CPJCM30710_24970 [Clostridium polyendosporum]|uniref:Phage minor structural protein, N-terminal region n=1 Tax=Clostridium polyendosporum TaxID=69208 RepID=A0A919S1X6_9CLOT|nr:phage tail spike protein [Clostridium polyendosporum]GIM29831.1 hypothetical protein CPJCM30710_24970 [Clostridium polyendosporum]
MICVYDKKTTKGNFDNNGLAVLNECIKCEITHELNGDYSLDLEYPSNSKKAQYLIKYNIIKAAGQLFRIIKITKENKDQKIISVWARHIFYDLNFYFIENVKAELCSVKTAMTKALIGDLPLTYTVGSDIVLGSTIYFVEDNPAAAMFNIIKRWGRGELLRDNFDIKILQSMGSDNGVTVRRGKNIEAIKVINDATDIVTKIYPKGNNNVKLTEKYISVTNWDGEDYPPFPLIKEVKFDADDEPTLRTLATAAAATIGLERSTIEVDMIELSRTVEYKNYTQLETISVGDSVTIIHDDVDVNVKVPVIKIITDVLTGLNSKVTFGQPRKPMQDLSGLIQTISDDLGNQVAQALSSMMYYSNGQTLTIGTTLQQPIYLGVAAIADTNLFLSLSMYGTASQACTLTIEIQLDNKDIVFTPKQKLQAGDNVVGIPLGIPQVGAGGHYIGVFLKVDAGTFTIPIYNLQAMVDGRNLQGGLSAEIPHAEASSTQYYINVKGSRQATATSLEVAQAPPVGNTTGQSVAYQNVKGSHVTATNASVTLA